MKKVIQTHGEKGYKKLLRGIQYELRFFLGRIAAARMAKKIYKVLFKILSKKSAQIFFVKNDPAAVLYRTNIENFVPVIEKVENKAALIEEVENDPDWQNVLLFILKYGVEERYAWKITKYSILRFANLHQEKAENCKQETNYQEDNVDGENVEDETNGEYEENEKPYDPTVISVSVNVKKAEKETINLLMMTKFWENSK